MSWGQHHLMVVNVNTFIDRLTPSLHQVATSELMTDDFLVLLLFVATNKDLLHHSRLSYRLGDSRLFFFSKFDITV
jgi:hypothetical protein